MDSMELARKADDAGDQAGCEKALGEAQRILNPVARGELRSRAEPLQAQETQRRVIAWRIWS